MIQVKLETLQKRFDIGDLTEYVYREIDENEESYVDLESKDGKLWSRFDFVTYTTREEGTTGEWLISTEVVEIHEAVISNHEGDFEHDIDIVL